MLKWLQALEERIQDRLSGHIRWGRLTLHGFSAMHVALRWRTRAETFICFHPPVHSFGQWWPWYFYISPNGTPQAATYAIGPGIHWWDRVRMRERRHIASLRSPTR